MNETIAEEQDEAILNFMGLAKRKFENGSFFKLYQFILSHVRETEEDETTREELISFLIKTFERVLTKDTECPHCNSHYNFSHIVLKKGWHCIEISCDPCGDYFTFSEEKESGSYFNIKVISKISSLNRRGKGLSIKTFRGDHSQIARLSWEREKEIPTLWINIEQVRKADEVAAYWKQSKKEIMKRNCLATSSTG
jgi:transcription elongation factor Elf1